MAQYLGQKLYNLVLGYITGGDEFLDCTNYDYLIPDLWLIILQYYDSLVIKDEDVQEVIAEFTTFGTYIVYTHGNAANLITELILMYSADYVPVIDLSAAGELNVGNLQLQNHVLELDMIALTIKSAIFNENNISAAGALQARAHTLLDMQNAINQIIEQTQNALNQLQAQLNG